MAPTVVDFERTVPIPRHHVLYVEDQELNVLLMEAVLANRPSIALAVAVNGEDGYRQATDRRPDLLLLDWRLPDCNGGELLRRLRAHPELADVPAIAVTAEDNFVDVGFDDLWPKPLDVPKTLARLDAVLERIESSAVTRA